MSSWPCSEGTVYTGSELPEAELSKTMKKKPDRDIYLAHGKESDAITLLLA